MTDSASGYITTCFQSTRSARSATKPPLYKLPTKAFSIHALREERDAPTAALCVV